MKTLTSLFRPALLLAALPTALAFSACSNDDDDNATPVPDQGKVTAVHAAPNANVKVSLLVDDKSVKDLNYGENSGYLAVDAGSRVFKINVAGSSTTVATATQTVAKDKNYSLFAYSPTTQANSISAIWVEDDLTAPAANQAKVRVVHLGLNAPSPVKLSQETVAGSTDVPGISAAFGAASAFASVPAGTYNLLVTTGAASTKVVAVGDGSGSGTGTKNYEAGKIYTVVVRGSLGNLDANLQPKAVLIQNN
ncbi:DUF4397 domain-containing protein [Hymenobacter metallilatus]|uniref:DUF4397 domain-containing protein n=1 Tax=Hymenobacter metallilatus TaxID=2493666 RepID=A0A428JP74_9BACT|nr:DUF4397 domain-containing protein [Hymenobacter metallilatus]RSK35159.1 DUF4397 domain-containing protein [Hymenobacter metallilatus]